MFAFLRQNIFVEINICGLAQVLHYLGTHESCLQVSIFVICRFVDGRENRQINDPSQTGVDQVRFVMFSLSTMVS